VLELGHADAECRQDHDVPDADFAKRSTGSLVVTRIRMPISASGD
jgi:hypothetical protein